MFLNLSPICFSVLQRGTSFVMWFEPSKNGIYFSQKKESAPRGANVCSEESYSPLRVEKRIWQSCFPWKRIHTLVKLLGYSSKKLFWARLFKTNDVVS